MKRANEELRNYAKNNGVKLWQIADKFGISDGNFSRKLRKELSTEDYNKFIKFVDEIAGT